MGKQRLREKYLKFFFRMLHFIYTYIHRDDYDNRDGELSVVAYKDYALNFDIE